MASVPTTTHPGGSNPQIAGSKNSQQVEQFVNSQLAKAASYVKVVDLFGSLMNLMWATLIGFLLLAIVDAWIFELPMWLRSLAFLTLAGAAIAWLAKYTVPLLIYRVSPAYAARSIEKRRPELKNSLINYLSMRGETRFSNTNVFQLIGLRAATDLNEVPTDDAADTRKLIRIGIVLGAVLVVCVLYKFLSPIDPFQTVGRVLQPLADISRPSRITISEVTPGDHRLYFGEPLEVSARVKGDLNGQDVILVYKTLDGQESTRTIAMTESSNGIFSTILSTGNAGIQTSLSYWIVAGDGQSPEYRVEVRSVPTIVVEQIDYTYPEYTRQPKLQSKTNAKISGIEGTIVQLKAKSNVQLSTAIVEFLINLAPDQNAAADYQVVDTESLSIDLNELAGDFRLRLDNDRKATKYTHYRFSYAAAEDGRNRKSDIYPVHVIADLAPEISVTDPTSIENTVALNRVLDFNVEAIDPDFEISKIQAVLVGPVHNRDSRVNLNLQQKSGFAQVTGQYQFNPKALRLEVGSEISIDFRAFDNRQSAASKAIDPNITKSMTYKIRVTEPEYSSDSNESAASKTDSENQQNDKQQDSNDKSNDSNSVNNKSEQSSQNSNDRKSDENQSVENKNQNQADKTDNSNANTDQNDSNQKNNDQNSENKNDSTQMNKDSNPNESHQTQENKNQPPNQNDKESGDQNKNDVKNSNQENKQDKRSDNSSQNSDQKNSDQNNSDQKNSNQKNSDNRSKDNQQQSKQNSSQQDQSNRDSSQNNKNDGNNQQNQGSQTDQNESQNSSSQSGANNSEKSGTQNGSQDPSNSNQRSADGSNNQKSSDQSATNNSQTNQGSENSNDPRPGNPSGTNDRPLDHEGDRFEKLLEKYKDEIKRLKDQENQSRQNENNNDQSSTRSDQSDENNSSNPEANTDQNNADKENSADSRQGDAKDKQNPNENAAENSSDSNMENKNAQSSKNESNTDQKGQPKDGMNNKLDGSDENGGQPDKRTDENQTNKDSNQSAASDQESKKNAGSNQNKDQSAKSENGADQKIDQNNSSNDNSSNNQDKSADNKSSDKTASNETGADRAADPNRKKDASETDQNNNRSKQNDSTAAQSSDNKNESGDANDSNRKNSTDDQNSDQPGNQSNQQNSDKKSDDSNKNAQSSDSNSKQNSKTDPRANQSDDNENDLKKSGNSKDSNKTQSSNEANSQRKDQSDAKNARAKQNNKGNMDPAAPRLDGKTGRKDERKRTSTPSESEKANIEYAKNATDLVLKYLEDQQDKDNDELLNEMNWTREEMSEFIKRWREMKNAADQGGSSEKREFNDALKSLGLRPPSNEVSNANIKNDNQRNMKEDGAISKPPADLVKKFRAFQRGRSRSESNR